MAERRMFAKTVVLSDDFLDLPPSARCLYFTYGMVADDDGFVNNPKSVMRQCGSTAEDIQQLVDSGYIIKFDSGVIAITAWRLNNLIRTDRYVPTVCEKEKGTLKTTDSGFYVELTCGSESEEKSDCYVEMTYGSDDSTKKSTPVPHSDTNGIPSGNHVGDSWYTQDSIGEFSTGEVIKQTSAHDGAHVCEEPKRTYFTPPTIEEVREYCRSRNNNIDPEQFCSFYESKGWMVGQNRMKDWKASVRTWERGRDRGMPAVPQKQGSFDTDDFFQAALNRAYGTEGT